jgi:HEAT repeat protein/ATP/ADP translocase
MFSKINSILNVSSKEWPRILVAWSLMFLTRFGFITGWSIFIATFLGQVGIDKLPLLFLVNAILVVLGTFVFRHFIHKIRRELLITFTALSAAALLLASILFLQNSSIVFFILILIAEGVLLAQLGILLSLFNEDLFSPLESQRTFPIIESAETLGGIAGGLTLSLLANQLAPYKFMLVWAIVLILILPIILKFNAQTMEVPSLEKEKKKRKKIHESFSDFKKVPFLKGLMVVILLHWGMMNIIEFQYTKAIQQDVYSVQEQTIVIENIDGLQLASEDEAEAITKKYEQEIARKLGLLHVIFNGLALFIQLVLASRIITRLGIVSSLMIHPLLTLFNLIGMTLRFNFTSAALTRGSYEISGLIFKSAYDSSYYAIPHSQRGDVKEFMQGIMKPIGAILGTVAITLAAIFTKGSDQSLILNIMLIGMSITMAVIINHIKPKYTQMSEQNLSRKNDLPTRLNAIEILAQKGHLKFTSALNKLLKRSEPSVIKCGILSTLGEQEQIESLSSILDMLDDQDTAVKLAAIQALSKFHSLESYTISKHRVILEVKAQIKKEQNEQVLEALVQVLHSISPDQISAYLLEEIECEEPKKIAKYIRMLKLFDDPNLKSYLEKYLKEKNTRVKSACIIALWQFEEMKIELTHYLNQMLNSPKKDSQLQGIQTCGAIKEKSIAPKIKKFLKHKDEELRNAALLCLAQLGDESVSKTMIQHFTDPSHAWFKETNSILNCLPKGFKQNLEASLHLHVADLINCILSEKKALHELEVDTLKYLKQLYQKINAHHEAYKIKKALDYIC